MMPVSLRSRTSKAIAQEWDDISEVRWRQIESGSDHSATKVLAPAVLRLLKRTSSVLDVGCGTGWLTARMARQAQMLVGIDISGESINLARRKVENRKISFINASVGCYARTERECFSAAVANMTLGTVPKLSPALKAIHRVLRPDGLLIATIPHPCFWPYYWGYAEAGWFDYGVETAIRAPFRIGAEGTSIKTTHIHRPLGKYLTAFREAGFELDRFEELRGNGFKFPRFLAMRWHRRCG